MDDVVTPFGRFVTKRKVLDIAFMEAEGLPLRFGDHGLDLVKVAFVTGDEVINADNFLPIREKGLKQVRADESSATSD